MKEQQQDMRAFLTAVVLASVASFALAQTQPTDTSASPTLPTDTSAIATPAISPSYTEPTPDVSLPDLQAPQLGANLFTEDQAKSYITGKGFSNVSDLQRDEGIWRGKATKDGTSVALVVDLQGNIISKIDP